MVELFVGAGLAGAFLFAAVDWLADEDGVGTSVCVSTVSESCRAQMSAKLIAAQFGFAIDVGSAAPASGIAESIAGVTVLFVKSRSTSVHLKLQST